MKKTKKDSPKFRHVNFKMYFQFRYMYGRWDFGVKDKMYYLDRYLLTAPLNTLIPSYILKDIIRKICLAKRSKNIEEFMEVFKIEHKETIADYYGLPMEEMDRLLQNEAIFDTMKSALAYMIICDMLLTPITCDCGHCLERHPLSAARVQEDHSQYNERIEWQKEKQNQNS